MEGGGGGNKEEVRVGKGREKGGGGGGGERGGIGRTRYIGRTRLGGQINKGQLTGTLLPVICMQRPAERRVNVQKDTNSTIISRPETRLHNAHIEALG